MAFVRTGTYAIDADFPWNFENVRCTHVGFLTKVIGPDSLCLHSLTIRSQARFPGTERPASGVWVSMKTRGKQRYRFKLHLGLGFPGGNNSKGLACQCRWHQRRGFKPWVGKIRWRRAWQPTPVCFTFLFQTTIHRLDKQCSTVYCEAYLVAQWNSCTPVADSCQCMAKPIPYCKVN